MSTHMHARTHTHTHTHTHRQTHKRHTRDSKRVGKRQKNKLNQVADRPFIIITIFNKTQIR